jgi:hypothetical protein
VIELVASADHYRAHLEPVWAAIPDELKGGRDIALVASYRDLLLAGRKGFSRFAYLEHGIGQSYSNQHPAYPGGGGRRSDVELFLSPNETAAAADRRATPRARVDVVGDPRLDTLPARSRHEPGGPVVAVSFHWDSVMVPETRSAFRHYAAWLAELAREYFVIGHAHPRARAAIAPIFARAGIPFVASFDDVCRRADLYVCDNSSTLYEFASTGRPVVVLNLPAYRRTVHHGLRFWDAAGVGINVDRPEQLVDAVGVALVDRRTAVIARRDALAIAYGYPSGAGERAAAAIVDWLT